VYDPDLAVILYQVRQSSIPLVGGDASEVLDPVPTEDLRRAMKDCLPGLMDWLKGDERNVILTLARIWVTLSTGDILPKDEAAKWAIPRLPQEQAVLLDLAGKAYLGEYADSWDGLYSEVLALAIHMKKEIEACLDNGT
jgi:streptomycin 3"-adenylyltransferase